MAEASEGTVTATPPAGASATATIIAPHVTATTVEYGEPSPMPEMAWGWRRTFVFVVTAVLLGHVIWVSQRMTDVTSLRMIVRNDQGLIFILLLLYLAGANAEAITKMLSAVRTSRREVTTSAPAAARDNGELPPDQRVNP